MIDIGHWGQVMAKEIWLGISHSENKVVIVLVDDYGREVYAKLDVQKFRNEIEDLLDTSL